MRVRIVKMPSHLAACVKFSKQNRAPPTARIARRSLAMTDVETDAQERHLSIDNDASSPLDGDDGARGEAAAVAEPDENDTWVDPRTGEVFHRLSPFERKVVSLVIGEGVERLKLLQELKVDPEEQVRRRTRARTSLIRPDRPDPHPSRELPDLADRAHPTQTVRDPRPRTPRRRSRSRPRTA